MSVPDRTKWTKGLIAKISVITGWVVPYNEVLNILVDQLEKKLTESYPNTNPDEVEYAFRERGTLLEDWGKEMNLAMFDKVMIPYMEKRFEASKVEQQQKEKLMLPEKKEDMSDNAMVDFWENTAKLVKNGGYAVDLIPPGLYEWMDESGGINLDREKKNMYMERAMLYRHSIIASAYEKNPHSLETKQALVDFNRMRETKEFSQEEKSRLQLMAKKMVVFDMMKAS